VIEFKVKKYFFVMSELVFLEAAAVGSLGAVQDLVREGGFDINFQHPINGWTALHWAVYRSHAPIVQFLISRGAQQLCNSKGQTPADLVQTQAVADALGVTSVMEIDDSSIIPNYIQYPVVSSELYNMKSPLRGKRDHDESDTMDVSVEVLVKNGEGVLVGSVKVLPECTMKHLQSQIWQELETGHERDSQVQLMKQHSSSSLLVPVSQKQLQKTVQEMFGSTSDTLTVHIQ
jgi:hypothetical protein